MNMQVKAWEENWRAREGNDLPEITNSVSDLEIKNIGSPATGP